MTTLLIILLYITIFSYFIYKFSFYKLNTISKFNLIGLLNIKLLTALSYVFISNNYVSGGDIFLYYNDSLIIFDYLKSGELFTYLQLTFGLNNTNITNNITQAINQMGFWFDTPSYFIVRLNSIFNIFSFGKSIYINALFFGFISFNACLILAKLFHNLFKSEKNWISYFIFLTPSLLYWTSGMHKESVSIFLISTLLFAYFKLIKKVSLPYTLLFLTSILLLVFTRVFIITLFIPPLLSYYIWTFRQKIRPLLIFIFVSALTIIFTYLIPQITQTPNLVDAIIAKKQLYEALGNGNTAINLGVYQQSYLGIIMKMPQALFNSLVRPHFLDIHSFFLFLASIESFVITTSFIVSIFHIKNLNRNERATIIIFLFFSISYLILTGLIVPNLGAILRYRSIAFFLLIPSITYLLSKKDKLM